MDFDCTQCCNIINLGKNHLDFTLLKLDNLFSSFRIKSKMNIFYSVLEFMTTIHIYKFHLILKITVGWVSYSVFR